MHAFFDFIKRYLKVYEHLDVYLDRGTFWFIYLEYYFLCWYAISALKRNAGKEMKLEDPTTESTTDLSITEVVGESRTCIYNMSSYFKLGAVLQTYWVIFSNFSTVSCVTAYVFACIMNSLIYLIIFREMEAYRQSRKKWR